MAKYRVLISSFIGNTLCKEGDIVEYDGTPGNNLEALDPPAVVEPPVVEEPPVL